MRLVELFDIDSDNVTDGLRNAILDVLTPLAARDVESVTLQWIADTLRDMKSGMVVDRALIMTLLDPNAVKLVKEIDGDRVYLSTPTTPETEKAEEEEQKDKEKLEKKASDQAKKEIKKS